jgi:hypothetical protein
LENFTRAADAAIAVTITRNLHCSRRPPSDSLAGMLARRTTALALLSSAFLAGACGDTVTTFNTTSSGSSGSSSGGLGGAGGTSMGGAGGTSLGGQGGTGLGGAGFGGTGGTGGSTSSSTSSSTSASSSTSSASSTSSSTSASSSSSTSASSSSSTSSSSSSSTSASSSSSGGTTCTPPDPLGGAPVTATPNQWTWVPVPGAKCRNGSATGFGVRINPNSNKLFIYLEGGGACFNAISCVGNPSSFGSSNFSSWASGGGTAGIFNTTNAANPVKDWNAVYIPYCTGDVHGGNLTGVNVPGNGPQNQAFVGYANVGLYMARIVPTFPNVTEVLLTGASAGGFGALYNYDRVAQDFCPTPVVLIDDSGPPMSDTYLAPCLQTRWRTIWGLNQTLPPDCPAAIGPNGGGIVNAVTCLGTKYAKERLGLISSNQDGTIAQFYGFGQNNCANIDGFASALPGTTYAAGLNELRTVYMSQSPAWGTYFIPSTTHTWIPGNNSFFNTTVMSEPLPAWVGDMVNGGPIANIGP